MDEAEAVELLGRNQVYSESTTCLFALEQVRWASEAVLHLERPPSEQVKVHNLRTGLGTAATFDSVTYGPDADDVRNTAKALAVQVVYLVRRCAVLTEALRAWSPPASLYAFQKPPRIAGRSATCLPEAVRDLAHAAGAQAILHLSEGKVDEGALTELYLTEVQLGLPGVPRLDGGIKRHALMVAEDVMRTLQGFEFDAVITGLRIEEATVAERAAEERKRGNIKPFPPTPPPEAAELVANLQAVAQRVAAVIESASGLTDEAPPLLPVLGPRDREVHALMLMPDMTQAAAAREMNRRFPRERKWTQPRISEALTRIAPHIQASLLAEVGTTGRSRAPARTLDPAVADQGERTDGKAHYLRARERERAKESDDEE